VISEQWTVNGERERRNGWKSGSWEERRMRELKVRGEELQEDRKVRERLEDPKVSLSGRGSKR
jgi:hypothetical protein